MSSVGHFVKFKNFTWRVECYLSCKQFMYVMVLSRMTAHKYKLGFVKMGNRKMSELPQQVPKDSTGEVDEAIISSELTTVVVTLIKDLKAGSEYYEHVWDIASTGKVTVDYSEEDEEESSEDGDVILIPAPKPPSTAVLAEGGVVAKAPEPVSTHVGSSTKQFIGNTMGLGGMSTICTELSEVLISFRCRCRTDER
jgi:hypothetical protein